VGAGLGCAMDNTGGGGSGLGCIIGAAVGAAIGMLSAVVIDAAALAWTTEKQQSERDSADHARLDWRVYASPTPLHDGVVAGVSGRM